MNIIIHSLTNIIKFGQVFLCVSLCFCLSSLSHFVSLSLYSPFLFLSVCPSCGDVSSLLDYFLLISSPWVVFVRALCVEVKTNKTPSFNDFHTSKICGLFACVCVCVSVYVCACACLRISTSCSLNIMKSYADAFNYQV